ncbi:MAG: cysteine--tRNA ligase [Nitrospirae bacterium]|nr:cysteine--tRNA ligase [Nitrospirota bacterium]
MKLYNTKTGKKEPLVPLDENRINIYVCGVTVYDLCHAGHARSAIVFDVLSRYLKYMGFSVTFVKNFTDIDDKIIARAKELGIPWQEVTERFTRAYHEDMAALGVRSADIEPKATEHIEEIKTIISGLIDKGYAYEMDGDVYFEVEKFSGYGSLSKRDLDTMEAGARVAVNEKKRNPMDFALWKASKPDEPSWESPWGPGRPGWHIECSAMSMKYLGTTFDIHGGGADLIFPHHENEIAQSEAFSGKPFVNCWVHNGFITIDKEKMSKSLNNFFTIRDILADFDAEVLRVFMISTHYRSPIEFSHAQLSQTEASIDRYYCTVSRISGFLNSPSKKEKPSGVEEEFNNFILATKTNFNDAMDDDLNSALAVGHVFELIREINRYLDKKPSGSRPNELLTLALNTLNEIKAVLNIFQKTPEDWYRSIIRTRKIEVTEDSIEKLINERQKARKEKDFAKADEIRKGLEEKGITLEDKPDGTNWRVKI